MDNKIEEQNMSCDFPTYGSRILYEQQTAMNVCNKSIFDTWSSLNINSIHIM